LLCTWIELLQGPHGCFFGLVLSLNIIQSKHIDIIGIVLLGFTVSVSVSNNLCRITMQCSSGMNNVEQLLKVWQ